MSARTARYQSTAAAGPSSARTSTATAPAAYEAPQFPLNPKAQRALAQLLQNHSLNQLDTSVSEAQASLSITAAEINDRLTNATKASKKRKERSNGEDGGDGDKSLEDLTDKVTRMTQRLEDSMMKLIDGQHYIQAIKESLDATSHHARVNANTQASTQGQGRRRRGGGDGNSDGEEYDDDFEPTDPAAATQDRSSALQKFKDDLERAKTRYQAYDPADRYSTNNDFVQLRRMVHDAQHGDDGSELPPASEWFPRGERPAPGVTTRRAAGRAEEQDADDSDDDIAVSKATISTKCPLTLQEFKAPLTSRKCPHSFESSAILEMISQSRAQPIPGHPKQVKAVQCPVSGCNKLLMKEDLVTDNVLARKIKRLQEAARLEAEESDDDGAPPGGTQGNATFIEDEDGEDVDDIVEGRTQMRRTQVKGEPKGSAVGRVASTQGRVTSTQSMSTGVVDLGGSSSEDEAEEGEDDDDGMEE